MKSDLPNSSQFSPVQTPLPKVLKIVKENQPDRKQTSIVVLQTFFGDRGKRTAWDWKLADNTLIAMSKYGLVNKPREDQSHISLTELGNRLYELAAAGQDNEMYAEFARHILLNLRGLDLVACVDDIVAAGQTPSKHAIVRELGRRGIYHPPNGTHANGMRQWLEQAGIVEKGGWVVDKDKMQALLGVAGEQLDTLSGLTEQQRDFARAFARLNTDQELSNKVAQYATTLFGTEFPEGGLPQSVLFALRDAGLIECEKTTKGQGAKPYIVRPTDKLRNEYIEPLLNAIEKSAGLQYRKLIRKSYPEIRAKLKSTKTHEKGLALEALAFYLARLLGLEFVQWRLRSAKTGGAELDVVMESDRLIFSRWQVQCKNSAQATLDDVAKEVGIAQVIKANVILIVTTGRVGAAARQFAEQVMRTSDLYVAVLDGRDLHAFENSPAAIAEVMNRQARGAMAIKRDQVRSD